MLHDITIWVAHLARPKRLLWAAGLSSMQQSSEPSKMRRLLGCAGVNHGFLRKFGEKHGKAAKSTDFLSDYIWIIPVYPCNVWHGHLGGILHPIFRPKSTYFRRRCKKLRLRRPADAEKTPGMGVSYDTMCWQTSCYQFWYQDFHIHSILSIS